MKKEIGVNELKSQEIPETVADTAFTKMLYINGKKIPGCQRVNVDINIDNATGGPLTKVTCVFTIAKDSLSIEENCIRFNLTDPKLDF